MSRRRAAAAMLQGPLAPAPQVLAACPDLAGQTVPSIAPNAAGDGGDTIPGAGGIVGARSIREAEPDELTLGLRKGRVVTFAATTDRVSMPGIASPLDLPVPSVPVDGTTERNLAPLRGAADVVARSIVTGSEPWLRELDAEAARRQGG